MFRPKALRFGRNKNISAEYSVSAEFRFLRMACFGFRCFGKKSVSVGHYSIKKTHGVDEIRTHNPWVGRQVCYLSTMTGWLLCETGLKWLTLSQFAVARKFFLDIDSIHSTGH